MDQMNIVEELEKNVSLLVLWKHAGIVFGLTTSLLRERPRKIVQNKNNIHGEGGTAFDSSHGLSLEPFSVRIT